MRISQGKDKYLANLMSFVLYHAPYLEITAATTIMQNVLAYFLCLKSKYGIHNIPRTATHGDKRSFLGDF